MVKHNQSLLSAHLRKHWMRRVRCFFNKAAHKKIRAKARTDKELATLPRPLGKLRPVVHSMTQKYGAKTRLGRGFTLAEVKAAGLTPAFARSVGIAVDHRRHNKSAEMQAANVARLEAYKSKLILFPRKEGKGKKGMINDSGADALKNVKSASDSKLLKLPAKAAEKAVYEPLTKAMKESKAYEAGRNAWVEKRDYGRKKRAAELAAAKKK
jgi:large subunit ribosomal protein L13e